MDHYVTGKMIKSLREKKHMKQAELADLIGVSDKTISKWETMRGLPDITLLAPLAAALDVSVPELMAGEYVTNHNVSGNMLKSCLYVCPVCGNIIHTVGECAVSCHGIMLPVLSAEECDGEHALRIERIEDEYYISLEHSMSKEHHISFIAYETSDRFEMIRLYSEENAEARFRIHGHGILYAYCNHHGLMWEKV